jgi:hypothetical protein
MASSALRLSISHPAATSYFSAFLDILQVQTHHKMSFLSPTASSIFGGSGNEDGSLATGHGGMLVNESCLDFLMMELVDAMCRTAIDEDTDREVIFYKLEMLGYRVGQSLVER